MFAEHANQADAQSELSTGVPVLQRQDLSTQTIDINSLLTSDVCSTGSFDLRSLESSSFGKLLDAVPLPILLIDQWHHVVFVNQACHRIGRDCPIVGRPFEELVPAPSDANRARALTDKTIGLLENAFATRKPQTAEAILQFGRQKKWCRLHLRSIRMALQRHILMVIEDLTYEKAHQRLSVRQEELLRNEYAELKARYGQLVKKYEAQNESLLRETGLRKLIEAQLILEKETFQAICQVVPGGVAIAGGDGTVKYCNEPFKELFGEQPEDLVSERPADQPSASGSTQHQVEKSIWREALTVDQTGISETIFFTVARSDEKVARVHMVTLKLSNGDYLVTCNYL